ncbi:NAD(P)H-hydrate dehydratase [Xylophilus sp. Kf1]|nr:NAD(P)H-hydrate dehydratase [Xylophilus sp. Kf1]
MIHRITTCHPRRLSGIAATRRLEAAAAAGLPPHTLMARAGAAIADLARALAPHAGCYLVFCGPGNNGGDGFEAAFRLAQAGAPVTVVFGGDAGRLPADARCAFDKAQQAGVGFSAVPPRRIESHDFCIDAVLGIGAGSAAGARTTPSWLIDQVECLHRAPCTVLAVDVPSGLDADAGQFAHGLAPAAAPRSPRHTLCLLTLKPGLFTAHGRDACGTLWFDDLGVPDGLEPPDAMLAGAPLAIARSHDSHKGRFGDVSILGGEGIGRRGMGMTGAALLAATAALHAGAGRVMVALLDADGRGGVDTSQPELMFRTPQALALDVGTIVCGCGGGEAVREWLPQVLRKARRLVLDADALNAIAADARLQAALIDRDHKGAVTVLTPHPLEAARLLDTNTATVQADRLAAARALAERYACIVVLKGSGTVVASPGEIPTINPSGNGRLATAGTGDVLAGMLGAGLAAAGADADLAAMVAIACDAVYRHGALADEWRPDQPLTAGQLARQAAGR